MMVSYFSRVHRKTESVLNLALLEDTDFDLMGVPA